MHNLLAGDRLAYNGLIFGGFLIIVVLLFLANLQHTAGHFAYSLDNAYVRLSMAENLLHGHYGVNPVEPSAASSSLLYPVLLAPLLALGFNSLSALVLNLIAALVSLYLLEGLFRRSTPEAHAQGSIWLAGLILTLAFCLNFAGLVFTGLEHNLQLLTVLLVIGGLQDLFAQDRVSPGLALGMVLGPLFRFENLSVSLAVVVIILLSGHWRGALLLILAALIPIALAVAVFLSAGLPVLPASVLAHAPQNMDLIALLITLKEQVIFNLSSRQGAVLLLLFALLASSGLYGRRPFLDRTPAALLTLLAALIVGAQLLVGSFTGFPRYEIFALLSVVACLILVLGGQIETLLIRSHLLAPVSLFILAAAMGFPYLQATAFFP